MRLLLAVFLTFVCLSGAQAIETLQPGDSIAISVLQDPKLDRQMLVDPNGMISFPLAGQIRVKGLTTAGLEKALKRRLRSKYTGELDVTVTYLGLAGQSEYRPRFYVTGEVKAPGAYPLRVRTDVVQGIALAGGLGIFASKHRIEVRRKVRGVDHLLRFDYAAYEDGADFTGNFNLRPGDTIIVPERNIFGW
jgi:polysaccharide export outer membrane protein